MEQCDLCEVLLPARYRRMRHHACPGCQNEIELR